MTRLARRQKSRRLNASRKARHAGVRDATPHTLWVCENMYDAEAWVERGDDLPPRRGWNRVWGVYPTRQEAERDLPAAREYAAGRRI